MFECGNEVDEEMDSIDECPLCGEYFNYICQCPGCGTLYEMSGDIWECPECKNGELPLDVGIDFDECPSCGALMISGVCDECGWPDVNQGWLGENYG